MSSRRCEESQRKSMESSMKYLKCYGSSCNPYSNVGEILNGIYSLRRGIDGTLKEVHYGIPLGTGFYEGCHSFSHWGMSLTTTRKAYGDPTYVPEESLWEYPWISLRKSSWTPITPSPQGLPMGPYGYATLSLKDLMKYCNLLPMECHQFPYVVLMEMPSAFSKTSTIFTRLCHWHATHLPPISR